MEHLTLYHNCVLKDMQIFSTAQKGRSKFNIEKEVQVIYSYVMHKFFFFFRVWFLQLIYFEYVDSWMLCDNETSFNLNILSILGIPFSYFEIEHNVWFDKKNQNKEGRYFICLFLYSSVKSIQFTIIVDTIIRNVYHITSKYIML